jgi:putative amidoligase enzyme
MGNFSKNVYNNVRIDRSCGGQWCINEQLLRDNGYFEDIAQNTWLIRSHVDTQNYKQRTTIRNEKQWTHKGYNIEDNVDEFEEKKKSYANYPVELSKDVRKFARFLGDKTFGIEVETSEGSIGDNLQHQLGLIVCRDGSIHGGAEFVSVPMQGAKGLQNIVNIGNTLKMKCNINTDCSYHIHIGNLPTDKAYMVALYMLVYKIQDDLLKMFPYYKTDHRGIKQKNYCQKLKKMGIHAIQDTSKEGYNNYINQIYEKIFTFLSDGAVTSAEWNKRLARHPVEQKWMRKSRYFGVNLENMLFSPRRTCEHRTHEATTNSQKMVAWLYICVAINRYAETHLKEIILDKKKIKLEDVLNFYKEQYPRDSKATLLSDYLNAYYKSRVEYFAADLAKDDRVSESWLKNDKKYVFQFNNTTQLF